MYVLMQQNHRGVILTVHISLKYLKNIIYVTPVIFFMELMWFRGFVIWLFLFVCLISTFIKKRTFCMSHFTLKRSFHLPFFLCLSEVTINCISAVLINRLLWSILSWMGGWWDTWCGSIMGGYENLLRLEFLFMYFFFFSWQHVDKSH